MYFRMATAAAIYAVFHARADVFRAVYSHIITPLAPYSMNGTYLLGIAGIFHDRYAELHHVTGEHLVRLLLFRYGAPVVIDERAIAALIVL